MNMKRYAFTPAIVAIVLLPALTAAKAGYEVAKAIQESKSISANISLQEKLDFLQFARYSHQYWVEHPDKTNEFTGTAERNEKWVRFYDSLILDYEERKGK